MMYLFFSIFLSPDKTHTAKQQTDTDEKRKAQAKWCAQSVYRTMLCEQQSFQVKDPFEDTVLCFSLSLFGFFVVFYFGAGQVFLLSAVVPQPMAIGTQIF